MNIIILGWYGTETLGDRAILLGLFDLFSSSFDDVKISIGSLYPFFTERSLYEDRKFIELYIPSENITYFDVKEKSILSRTIKSADLVLMGGGPMMDLHELWMIKYSFSLAKKYGVKTAVIGVGIGPLLNFDFQKVALDILSLSDLIILRDKIGEKNIKNLEKIHHFKLKQPVWNSYDPAILPIKTFLEYQNSSKKENNIVINLREFPCSSFQQTDTLKIDHCLMEMLKLTSDAYEKITLFPMHTFSIGGDDRLFLSKIKFDLSRDNINILHIPMSVWKLFELIHNATASIGMRYHSVVFETLLNGNNIIVDYTEPQKGKIIGFLDMIDHNDFYNSRYLNLQNLEYEDFDMIKQLNSTDLFSYDTKIFTDCKFFLTTKIKNLF